MQAPSPVFDYFTAFQRNIGFLTLAEQQKMHDARVAIAGLGGTGGAQVHALSRMGIGKFTLADPDTFELVNFNRQLGATMDTIGRPKATVMSDLVHSINPEADVRLMPEGIGPDNISQFLEGVDVVVDSLDFYCFKERFLLYRNARERGIWVLTSPPLGFGFTLLIFDPKGMSFEDYFGFTDGMDEFELSVSLIAGIAPKPWMMRYLNKEGLDAAGHRLPSVGAAPFMIAGVIATEVMNLITRKQPVMAVPEVLQFDALLRRFRRARYPLGMRGPLQRVKKVLLRRHLRKTG
jgi:molybdopterin/thiamine biosynthesis adenylyltransferase